MIDIEHLERNPTADVKGIDASQEAALLSLVKKDLRATLLFLAPEVLGSEFNVQVAARKLGLDPDRTKELTTGLFAIGLWHLRPDGQIQVAREHLQLGDLTVSEFMTMTLFLAAKLDSDGPCWYESYSIATNETVKREFIKDINQAFKRFIVKSREVKADRVVCWNHMSVDFRKDLQELAIQDRWEGL